MSSAISQSVRFTVVDAFTDRIFGGNPAAVLFLDDSANAKLNNIDANKDRAKQLIAREFNLSETAFISPKEAPSTSVPTFGLRWFTPKDEIPLCGHATLASAHVLFSTPAIVPPNASLIQFKTLSGTLTAKRTEDGKIELEFPAGSATEVDSVLFEKTKRAARNAIVGDHAIAFVGVGEGISFKHYMLIELEESFNLQNAVINPGALLDLAPEYQIIIFTTRASSASTHFESRTFGPYTGVPEDPVTGSAHCMLAPYWHQKLRLRAFEVMKARQVSERGGVLDVIWDQEKGTCRLIGQAKTAIKGELFVSDSERYMEGPL